MSEVTLERVGDAIGGRVLGVDLSKPLAPGQQAAIRQALLDTTVICIPGQRLDASDFIAFGHQFGELEPHVLTQYHHPEYADIIILSNVVENGKPKGISDGGSYWHSDLSYMRVPALATSLYALEVPESGGDTLFTDMYRAYETLPEATRQRIDGLTAIHSYAYRHNQMIDKNKVRAKLTPEQIRRTPDVVHPVVRTHPETGRKALYVNPGFTMRIVGMEQKESDELLQTLFEHAVSPEFQYRHTWSVGDVIMWDNRCSMHSATGGYTPEQPRTLFRITVTGTVPY
ncbi:MAG: TauD/TfdA family dioxygenase [Aquisalimonadaceae bacterium]